MNLLKWQALKVFLHHNVIMINFYIKELGYQYWVGITNQRTTQKALKRYSWVKAALARNKEEVSDEQ